MRRRRFPWADRGTRKTREHQFRFVADDGMGMIQRNFTPGDAQYPETFFFEGDVLRMDAFQDGFIDRLGVPPLFFITVQNPGFLRVRP